ncbi:hypothetical protein RSOLAG1IB_03210 [Rhizoctonia solani AG-1 IB]|uniref:Hydrophobin n=1 Tax=Thanatephorus cucumeris (strain AG1-IB / isolate 7/3/14) TaxID=1108050 RepID=M5BU78_THACB|nr:hypothetical protein BN14_04069 [Rhizoctonia solani AG-1 IB]CEL59277.1 hypothetical protein RSOLAG1IB_03210 [Rhizoctonia solani AG-1 IB]
MRSAIPLAIFAGLAAASPTLLTPSSRQTAYDVTADASSDSTGPLDLSDIGILSGGSGLLGASSEIAGLHLRHVKRDLLDGLSPNDVGGTLSSITAGGALSDLGLGIKRDHKGDKRLLNFGRPSGGFSPKGNTCPAGRRYCCKHVRKYSDSRNANLLDGALVQDGLLNDVLVGLTCDLIAGTLAPDSCDKHSVCCTSQRNSNQGLVNLGCTPFGLDISI